MKNFFEQLFPLIGNQDLLITIRKAGDQLTTSIMLSDSGKSSIVNQIIPVTLTGSPQDLDVDFFKEITAPLEKLNGLISNVPAFEKSVEKAAEESKNKPATSDPKKSSVKGKKEKTIKIKPVKEDKKPLLTRDLRFKLLTEKAQSLVAAKDYRNAIGVYQESIPFTSKTKLVKVEITGLVKLIMANDLFAKEEDLRAIKTEYLVDIEKVYGKRKSNKTGKQGNEKNEGGPDRTIDENTLPEESLEKEQ